jgi:CheY-like chemotaxis protein
MNLPKCKPRVLIIDDSDTARATIANTLLDAGYQVFEIASAIGATRTILRNQVQAVVVDVSMPGLSGDMLIKVLRRNVRFQDLTIIVVSGTEQQGLETIRQSGEADAVLPKALIPTDLALVLGRLLARPSRSRAVRG